MAIVFEPSGPCEIVRPGETYEIGNYIELLIEIGAPMPADPFDPPSAEQRAAVEQWLSNNRPSTMLAFSLQQAGFDMPAELLPVFTA